MKERLRMVEDETRTDVVAMLSARSRHVRDPGVNVWQCPWQ